ncbi:PREDICTED: tudor domain-containing protein 3 isoform X1 [Eufriesea mexicana]|uniref:tudor domain-containing protein 3 isoform X1 n=1 Tax=Eufriesea mexicana TaxID=516756 RepID=UPI00083BBDC0|nr:PREDICTED: tudor domain-containing protein 3 isoform X1 [Eufriesea mexicana]XP_017762522.1 PREDICTED: tudor domain-containing protein 3 isoform X1 [Eufriesea mexicana]XP_017762523.1 PREDICTED: tudor domain-containing protein 3 isoform X1 [Eufriesea mexicana]
MTVHTMEKLKEKGWYITDHGYNTASDSGSINDIQKIIKRLLDLDLREVGNGQGDITQGNIVLQIQKIRNVAVPKNIEDSRSAPRLLKFFLTDGKNNFQAIEVEHIPPLSLNTPPGTKILIGHGNLPISHGIILLRPSNIAQVLGGKVTNLVEKWELNKKLALHTRMRSAEEGGPPPWIPFGKKITKVPEHDRNFKALAEKEKSSKENTEFEAQRKDAIAEAAKQGSKKAFGGGNKQLLDHSVQKIVDQGFSIEQAEYALKVNRNNVDKALKSLQKTDNRHNSFKEPREAREPRNKRFDKKSEEGKPSSGKISLFDFLEDKLPLQSESTESSNPSQNSYTPNTENSYDKIELKNNESQSGKSGRSQKGGRGYQVPPRHLEENKNSKKSNFNNSNTQYSQYNGGNHSQQNKPPRFQRNQDNHSYSQQDTLNKTYQKSQLNDSRNYNVHTRTNGTNIMNSNNYYKAPQDQQGKHFGAGRNYNHYDTENSGGKGTLGSNNQRSQNQYSNNQNTNVSSVGSTWVWRVGDECLAKYWEDNRYYNAKVTGVSDRTCVVQFKGFENYEEVLQVDCSPITDDNQAVQDYVMDQKQSDQRFNNRQLRYDQTQNHITAGMEFRRGGSGVVPANKFAYNKKRNQQRSTQPIYQPPAQRCQNPMPMNTQNNSLL